MSIEITPFDAAEYLTDEETIAAYLNAAMEDPEPTVLLMALKDIANARGRLARACDPAGGAGESSIQPPELP